jgi:HD-like signal output (HDOD) protein
MTSEPKDGNIDKGYYPGKAMTFPMPADLLVLVQARKLAASPDNKLEELTLCVCQDPVLVVELFKAANSVSIGAKNSLTSIQAAITRLGTAKTLACLDELGERSSFENQEVNRWFEIHRSRGKRTAIIGRMLGQLLAKSFANECQLGGLLSAVGDMLAVLYLEKKYIDIANKNTSATVNYKLAQEHNINTSLIGPEYLVRNGVPQDLVASIEGATSNSKDSKFVALKPIVSAALELVDAFDSGRWDKFAPGRTLPSKSTVRLLQFSDDRHYTRLYERSSEYLFAVRTLEHKQKAAGNQLIEAAKAELAKYRGVLPAGVFAESPAEDQSNKQNNQDSSYATIASIPQEEPESLWSVNYQKKEEHDQGSYQENDEAESGSASNELGYNQTKNKPGSSFIDNSYKVPKSQYIEEQETPKFSNKGYYDEAPSTLVNPQDSSSTQQEKDAPNYQKETTSSQGKKSPKSAQESNKGRKKDVTENKQQVTQQSQNESKPTGANQAVPNLAPTAQRNVHPSKLIALEKAAETILAMSERMDAAKNSEELLATILISLVDDGPFEKTALVVISEDRRNGLVVAARGPNIGNGQRLILDDPLSPLSQCLSKIQSFGKEESSTSPFGSKTFAVAPIDADHATPVALYADCGNEGSITFEARRIFRTVVTLINEKLKTLPGGIPNEIDPEQPPAS